MVGPKHHHEPAHRTFSKQQPILHDVIDSPRDHETPPRIQYNPLCLDAYVSLHFVLCSSATKHDLNRCSECVQLRWCTKGEQGLWFGLFRVSVCESFWVYFFTVSAVRNIRLNIRRRRHSEWLEDVLNNRSPQTIIKISRHGQTKRSRMQVSPPTTQRLPTLSNSGNKLMPQTKP